MFQQNIFQGPGTGTYTSHTFEIIFMLLVTFLLGLWLGWVLWSKYRQAAEKLRFDNESLNSTATTLRNETERLKNKLSELESERSTLDNQVQSHDWETENLRNQLLVLQSDLEKTLARNRQLESELGLTAKPAEPADEVPLEIEAPVPAEPADSFIAIEDLPATSPAEPALEDVRIDAAAAPTTTAPAPATIVPAPETVAIAEPVVAAVVTGPRDDLKIVEGVGPKIEELLFQAGITTYGQLAATSVQQLKDILVDAGSRFAMHDPGTWSAQALLAANGEWENLKAYQEFLNAGKRPDKT
ncbi:MAG: hypothetical protein IPH12_10330 [Saprospirales bacterium]|jgi:predicted flap endonuclease-1-like 5' DNA nuclease/chaperonin cofactor prefoldin|nr:hypothetical protein [Saprospirales bacterium]MBK8922213.1 hypothetical protein [Saprospirales bacterium]